MKEEYKLSHLKELEAESIHIIREVAAEFENPVMLYSIGKDSSVMVRLAEKAFAPGKVPFPLMHIDSKWKFKEMIEFRDEYAGKYGWKIFIPKFSYTTDNAAMIAITGYFKYMDKDFCPMEAPAYSRVTLG